MAEDVPVGFTNAFSELRKMHAEHVSRVEELCNNLAIQTPIIESLLLQAHKDEIANVCTSAEDCPVALEVPFERDVDIDMDDDMFEVPHERCSSTSQLDHPAPDASIIEASIDSTHYPGCPYTSNGSSMMMASSSTGDSDVVKASCTLRASRVSVDTEATVIDHEQAESSQRPTTRLSLDTSLSTTSDRKKVTRMTDSARMSFQMATIPSEGVFIPARDDIPGRWGALAWTLLQRSDQIRVSKSLNGVLEVKPMWQIDPNDWSSVFSRMSQCQTRITKKISEKTVFAGTEIVSQAFFQGMVFHPDKLTARLMLCLGGVALAYDLIMVPFVLCFQINEQAGWVNRMNWILAAFWTTDMLVSSLTGYYEKVVVEMRPLLVVIHYFKTWGFLDLVINASDWTNLLLALFQHGSTSTSAVLSTGRALKYYRFLRILRMFRLFKLVQRLSSYIDGFATEVTLVFVKLLGLIIVIVLVSHYIACVWCALAYNSADGIHTWMTDMESTDSLSPADKMYVYVVAVHWSITQFTPATNNINPVNMNERVYAVVIVFFALIMFSSFLGSLTNALSQLKKIHVERYQEEEQLRKFIIDRKVSLNCARRIWHFYRTIYKSQSPPLCYVDIPFLDKLPRMLRMSLHEDISMPTMCRHGALLNLDNLDHQTMLTVCDRALTETGLRHGHEVFNTGGAATTMFFLTSGCVQYDSDVYSEVETLEAPQIICEVGLWTSWIHHGSLNATCTSFMHLLDVINFGRICRDHLAAETMRCMRRYAKLFVELVNDSLTEVPITDIIPSSREREYRFLIQQMSADAFQAYHVRKCSTSSAESTTRGPIQRMLHFPFQSFSNSTLVAPPG